MDCDRLLARLEKLDTDGLHRDFVAYFADLVWFHKDQKTKKNPKKTARKSCKDDVQLRPLAKRFLPALSRILKICPNLLSTPSEDGDVRRRAFEVFKIFKMSLDCFDCISSCLDNRPFDVDLQRHRLVRRFEAWSLHDDAREQAYLILNNLRKVFSVDCPDVTEEDAPCLYSDRAANTDRELGLMVLESVVSIVRCAFKSKCKQIREYHKILSMMKQIQPWLSNADSKNSQKYHGILLHTLYNCTRFIIGESQSFKGDLVSSFCTLTIAECLRSQSADMLTTMVHGLLYALGSHCQGTPSVFLDIMKYALDAIVCQSKHVGICFINHALDIVNFCMSSLHNASNDLQRDAAHLCDASRRSLQVVSPHVAAVLTLYSAGLFISVGDVFGNTKESVISVEVHDCMAEYQNFFITLSTSIRLINMETTGYQQNESEGEMSRLNVASNSHSKTKGICPPVHGEVTLMSYLKSLAFFCKPFGEFAMEEWKHMTVKKEILSFEGIIVVIDTLLLFCNAFITGFSNLCVKEQERLLRNGVLNAAKSALKISVISARHLEETMKCIRCIVCQDWIHPRELKFLISILYSFGYTNYKENQLDKASSALDVCYHASWTLASLVRGYVENSEGLSDHNVSISQAECSGLVADACSTTAFYLDVLHQSGNPSKKKVVVESLLNWSGAVNALERISSPKNLVKQWAKSICEDFKGTALFENCPTLHSMLMSSNANLSNKILGIILEEEVLAYAELDSWNPSFCRGMQERIVKILLEEVYVTPDFYVQRARILLTKSRIVLANNLASLNIVMEVLSETICVLKHKCDEAHASGNDSANHLLALTFCLRALFLSEVYSTQDFLPDISAALKLWSSIMISTPRFHCDQFQPVIREISLLYHIADLLAAKGLQHFKSEILMVIVKLSIEKGVPLEESLGTFCKDRRLTHTFCMSPVENFFLLSLQHHFGPSSTSVAFWISCVNKEALSMHGFLQKFFLSDIINETDLRDIFQGHKVESLNDIKEIKASAHTLISKDNLDYNSAVSAAHLYYDLSDQLLSSGQLIESLLCSKKALQLRTNILQKFFVFSIEKQPTTDIDVCGSILNNKSYNVHLEARATIIKELWSDASKLGIGLRSFVNHWSVVQHYLQSSLQVAILHDLVGNGDDAMYHLLVGKRLSNSRGLKLFEVLFCSWLGHTYRKMHIWHLAERELVYGKDVLVEFASTEFCELCKLALSATLEFRLADLIRSRSEQAGKESLSVALEHYQLAQEMLESFGSEVTSLQRSRPYPAMNDATACTTCRSSRQDFGICTICLQTDVQSRCKLCTSSENYEILKGIQQNHSQTKSLDVKKETEQLTSIIRPRKTRSSKPRDLKNVIVDNELLLDTSKLLHKEKRVPTRSSKRDIVSVSNNHQNGLEDTSLHLSKNQDCWRCFIFEISISGQILDVISLKLEHHYRNLLLRLSIQMGKCKRMLGKVHEAHDIFCRGACLLIHKVVSSEDSYSLHHVINYFGKESNSHLLTIDHGVFFYHIARFCLDHKLSGQLKICECGLQNVQVQSIVTLLEHAFIICREVPLLFRKVSRLLAVIHLASASGGPFHLPMKRENALSLFHWAAYFHQASLGGYHHHQSLNVLRKKTEFLNSTDPQETHFIESDRVLTDLGNSLRLAPTRVEDLERFVFGFFQSLPRITVTCICLLGGDDANLLEEMSLLPCAPFSAWIFLSRLRRGRQPACFLLPMNLISQAFSEDKAGSNMPLASFTRDDSKPWVCPWGCSLLDEVAPDFRQILEENFISSSLPVDTNDNRSIWWKRRTQLNSRLMALLKDIEQSWFGPWKCLLLGEPISCSLLDDVMRRLVGSLRNFSIEANENLLRIILSSHSTAHSEACISQFLSYKGWLGHGECCSRTKGRVLFTSTSNDEEESLDECHQVILNALSELANQGKTQREPVILVLDIDAQILPWESLPVLRNEEVYRMPSVGSISVLIDRWRSNHESLTRESIGGSDILPHINLFDAYYLLNPAGDLSNTQKEFEEWFKNQNWEGKTSIPSEDELTVALQKHELFLYFGHGSGEQYLSRHKIETLDCCAAALLMGCSSGCLSYKGCYLPKGVPLAYLVAGCPTIIANLWDVTDKDIDKLSKELLKSWLEREQSVSDVQENLQNVGRNTSKSTRRVLRGSSVSTNPKNESLRLVQMNTEQFRAASFMGKARDACKLPYLIGASSVCYGVPTFIRGNKK